MCGGSGIASCCEGPVGTAADVPGETRYLTGSEQRVMRRALDRSTRLVENIDTVVLHLPSEKRLLVRQELYHAVHTLEAQARVAKAGSTRQRALTRRAADLRSVADQLA
jgi:hypothetical protein